jgi:outer membrane immunogenic protein
MIMRFHELLLAATLQLLFLPVAFSQASRSDEFGLEHGQTPPLEIGLHYVYLHSNAPPTQCGCFSLNGGAGTMVVNMSQGFSLVADLSAAHASRVDGTTQNITLFNVLGGLRYSHRSMHRYTPYAQGLVGRSNEYSNYAFVQNTGALAVSGGLGLDVFFTRHIAWNFLEADYFYSRLPNATNDHQSALRLASGIIFRFGVR